MASLKTNWVDGDILTAGTIVSTSSMNGITATVNSNTITKLRYVGSDLTGGSIASSITETTLATVTIPANTISTGAMYFVNVKTKSPTDGNNTLFKIKSGVASSETQRYAQTVVGDITNGQEHCAFLQWYDAAPTWTANVNVIVTAQNNTNNANAIGTVYSLIVIGV